MAQSGDPAGPGFLLVFVLFGFNGVIMEPDVTSVKVKDQVGTDALGAMSSLLHRSQ